MLHFLHELSYRMSAGPPVSCPNWNFCVHQPASGSFGRAVLVVVVWCFGGGNFGDVWVVVLWRCWWLSAEHAWHVSDVWLPLLAFIRLTWLMLFLKPGAIRARLIWKSVWVDAKATTSMDMWRYMTHDGVKKCQDINQEKETWRDPTWNLPYNAPTVGCKTAIRIWRSILIIQTHQRSTSMSLPLIETSQNHQILRLPRRVTTLLCSTLLVQSRVASHQTGLLCIKGLWHMSQRLTLHPTFP